MTLLRDDILLEQLAAMDAAEVLRYAFDRHGLRAAIGTSLQKTGIVTIDLAAELGIPYRVFFIDTELNHPETYELLEQVERRYGITVERFRPDPADVEELRRSVGQFAHFLARPQCCGIRKRKPLQRAVESLDVWIAGLRADQSEHRGNTARKAEWASDENGRAVLKLNPLVDWTAEKVDEYSRRRDLPYNKLYDYRSAYGERYTVIGCQCCHIPVLDHLGERAGKFPWEQGKKECGLHDKGSAI